jgi:hypothetical protein
MHIKNTFITKLLLIFGYMIKVSKEQTFMIRLPFEKKITDKRSPKKKPRKKNFRGL